MILHNRRIFLTTTYHYLKNVPQRGLDRELHILRPTGSFVYTPVCSIAVSSTSFSKTVSCRFISTMANSNIKIYYFDEDGRAEVSRLVLTLAGKQFEDIRFSFEEWPKIKQTMPFGQVPVLEIDGKKYAQSLAIPAFLAREFGFYGQNNQDGLVIDMIAQLVLDFRVQASKHYYEKDPAKKEELFNKLQKEEAPRYLKYLEQILQNNGKDYMVGDKVTLADIIVFDVFTGALGKFVQPCVSQFPLLKQLVERIGSIDRIKSYVSSRP